MKLCEVSNNAFRREVEQLVAQDWAQDPIMPLSSADIWQLDDEEFEELQDQVDEIVAYAIRHNIKTPREAVDAVFNNLVAKQTANVPIEKVLPTIH